MKPIILLLIIFNVFLHLIKSFKVNISNKSRATGKKGGEKDLKNIFGQPKSKGHFEKYVKTVDEIVFIPGNEPSGLPNSFIITEAEALGQKKK